MSGAAGRVVNAAPCKAKCAGGRKCVCVGTQHEHHICNDPTCLCHQAHGYGLSLVQGAHGVMRYVPVGEVDND
jgi:hypothetical protein